MSDLYSVSCETCGRSWPTFEAWIREDPCEPEPGLGETIIEYNDPGWAPLVVGLVIGAIIGAWLL